MKNLLCILTLFFSLSAIGQEKDTIPQPPVLPVDTVAVVNDTLPVNDSIPLFPDTTAVELSDTSGGNLEAETQLMQLRTQLDSLKALNQQLAIKAKRRLTVDMFLDSFRTYKFYACTVDPEKIEIQLFNQKEGKKGVHSFASVASLAEKSKKTLLFAMNGGMFEKNRKAKGLLILNGEAKQRLDTLREGYGNFYMQPNGVFAIDSTNQAYVVSTQDYQGLEDSAKIKWATQSGPMLLRNGQINALFNDGSPNRHIRNAVGVTSNNEVVFAISKRPVTFFELTSFMIKQGCTNALYLDGAISQAYFADLAIGALELGNRLGPIIAIMK